MLFIGYPMTKGYLGNLQNKNKVLKMQDATQHSNNTKYDLNIYISVVIQLKATT